MFLKLSFAVSFSDLYIHIYTYTHIYTYILILAKNTISVSLLHLGIQYTKTCQRAVHIELFVNGKRIPC